MNKNETLPCLSKQEYFQIISTIKNPETKEEKFRHQMAVSYVRLNFNTFDQHELKTVMRNESLVKALGKDFEKGIVEYSTELNIQGIDKQKCVDIFRSSDKPISKDDKYQFHLALTYFKNNFLSFDKQELNDILSNEYVQLHNGTKFDREVLVKCVEKNKSFPIILSKWASGSIGESTLNSYLDIIHKENNEEQLNFFCTNRRREVGEYIGQKGAISPLLQDLYVKAYPEYILQVDWSEEKCCAWLDKYNAVAPSLFSLLYLYENKLGTKFKEKIYDSVIENLFSESFSESHKTNILTNGNANFLRYLNKNYADEFRNLLKSKISEDSSGVKMNFAQELISSYINLEYKEGHLKLYEIICDNKDLLLEPVRTESRLYEKKISIFEYGLDNLNFLPFAPFNLNNSVLEPQHREQLLAAAFCLLQAKYGVFNNSYDDDDYRSIQNFNHLSTWYPQIIDQATNEELDRYIAKAIKGKEDNTEFVKEINALKLKIELGRDLSENKPETKPRVKL